MRFGLGIVLAGALSAAPAQAHVERSAYWPDPAADCAVSPCAGGAVPAVRSLASALARKPPGDTRVVCAENSLALLKRSIATARKSGYDIRPTDHRQLSAREGRRLLRLNRRLRKRCRFSQIQPAVTASHNNDRVVVMPGLYTEPAARAQPTHDPACNQYRTLADNGDPGAVSHAYQLHCPNDANLIAVIGRDVGPGPVPTPALPDRHGIPNAGACIRCNVQLEGSGVSADDVVIEAGDPAAGNGGPSAAGHKKDVGVFVDRADGFVLRNVTVRHAREHDIYVMETDGYLLDRFKAFYAGGYGVLTFVEDHGLIENCDAAGSGDSGLYPGSGANTNVGRDTSFYPEARYSQELRFCDMHHNAGGFSGTNSHATHVHHNNFYDNALGLTTDVFTAPGHPGFPQQGNLIEENDFYSNNFNPWAPGSDVDPYIPVPVGTGLWLAGGNDNIVRKNRFWDNRRRATMLFAAPDVLVCGPVIGQPVPGCSTTNTTTSFGNSFYGNVMGVSTDGSTQPNGLDFWWDAFPGNARNCWYANAAARGRAITSSPAGLPDCAGGKRPESSVGLGDVLNESELMACFVGITTQPYPDGDKRLCSWTLDPPKPGRATSATASRGDQRQAFADICATLAASRACAPYADALPSAAAQALAPSAASSAALAITTGRPLSAYTCSWWRRADAAARDGLVRRIRRWVGGQVAGSGLAGYGAVLDDARASALFGDRCSQAHADAFALYKLYGAAAAFAGRAQ